MRYVAWLRRHTRAMLAGYGVVLAVAVYLIAYHLPLRADFSYLLPQDADSVRDLRRLEARVVAGETVLVIVKAPDPRSREMAVDELARGFARITSDLVQGVDTDDAALRDFLRAHRYLFVPLADLERARAALANRIAREKRAANPLYIDLDETPARPDRELGELRERRRAADVRLARSGHVSSDGRTAVIHVRAPFRATDAARGRALHDALDRVRTDVVAAHPGIEIGFTGSVITALTEHDAIASGIVWSSAITALLVALLVALYFRSARLLGLLVGTLVVATVIAFGIAAITVGHLNAATAFLGAIIAGNGINYGILLIARYLEERGRRDVDRALAAAIAGTLRPTAIASLGAAIAYGSLAATSFRGFADFALIGSIGMLACWVATYTLLPAALLVFAGTRPPAPTPPLLGRALVRVIGFRRSGAVCIAAALVALASFAIVARYLVEDPFEYDLRQLRSQSDATLAARRWMLESDHNFGRGISGRTYIAADRADQVPRIVVALRTGDHRTIGAVGSILDLVPEQQPEKLAVLAELRRLLDDPALAALSDADRAELAALRPPDGLHAITTADLPPQLVNRLTETDGRVGLLLSVRPADGFDVWDGRNLIEFAHAVRSLDLGGGEVVTTSGPSVIFADIVESIERDGPIVTAIAAAGLVVLCVLVIGRNRRALAVLLATGGGSLLMIATCAVLGLRVNFLDFIALPITLGLGIDYAINIAHRHDHDAIPDPIATLRTSGSAVFVCSLTTIIGYASLLASDNLAIQGFGIASLIGEITCVLAALVLVPAILAVRRDTRSRPSS